MPDIVADYGAVGDAEWARATLTIAASGTALTASTSLWAVGDVGKSIVVGQCGGAANEPQGGTPLRTTIAGYTSATQITLAAPAVSALTATPDIIVAWGTDSTSAFQDFKDDYQGDTVVLTIPDGTYLISSGNFGGLWDGIENITVNATGATIAGGLFQIQAGAQNQFAGHSGYTASVSAGATAVTLTTPADAAKFTVGGYAMMSGVAMQYGGYPTNHARFEYLKIASIVGAVVTFETVLVNSYLSTWPLYVDEAGGNYSEGGPATLYAMHLNFNHTCVVNGLTVAHHGQWALAGKSITLNDCVFAGVYGPYPTMSQSVVLNNCDGADCHMEVDKLNTLVEMNDCEWGGIGFQSSSTTRFVMDGTAVEFTVNGSPYQLVIRNNCEIGTLVPGPQYGYANELDVSDSVIHNFGAVTYHGSGHEIRGGNPSNTAGVTVDFTMADGVITIPEAMNAYGYVGQFSVPGGKLFFLDPNVGTVGSFTITDVTQDGSNSYLHTDWAGNGGSWPARTYGSLGLWMYTHSAPVCTFSNVTGCPEAVDLSGAPAEAPLYSYSRRTINDPAQTGFYWQMYGRFKYIKITVTTAYGGGIGTVQATLGNNNNSGIKASDGTDTTAFLPVINLKIAGVRIFDATGGTYPVAWTGAQSGDTLPSQAEALWCGGNYHLTMTDISSDPSPIEFTVEFITDQQFSETPEVIDPPSTGTRTTMLATRTKALYREHLHEPVAIRRITGTGTGRTDDSYATVGRVFNSQHKELTGGIAQQDRTAIIYAQALFDAGLPSDVEVGDYLIDQDGIEHSVYEVKHRRVEGVMIGYELTVRA